MVKIHLNNTDDDKRPWGNDEITRMLMNNSEMAMGDGRGIKKGCWKHYGCQVGQKQIGQQGVLRMLKMLDIMSKEAKKYIGNIGLKIFFIKEFQTMKDAKVEKAYMGQLHVSEP
jgi:hypothetical protein